MAEIVGRPRDAEVTEVKEMKDDKGNGVGVSIRLDSPQMDLGFWMELRLRNDEIEALYNFIHGGRADLPTLK